MVNAGKMSFDYIIIGAGSAGCVLANRLSEDPSNKVLLLEAGGNDTALRIKIPAMFPQLFNTKYDWEYESSPQRNMKNRRIFLPRGKVLGGSSSINAMIYIRGHKLDYDLWSALGNKGWSYDEVLPFFLKSEAHLQRNNPDFHAQDGELAVREMPHRNLLSNCFIEAAQQRGYQFNDDFNGHKQEGFGYYDVTQKDGGRCSTSLAFLNKIKRRKNLSIRTGVEVSKLLLQGNRAVGVIYQNGSKEVVEKCNAEIILSAGSYNSPKLLMLSGIGPADHLRSKSVHCTHDIKGVGQNLQDHPTLPYVTRCIEPISLDGQDTFVNSSKHLVNYLIKKNGVMSSVLCEAGGFVKTQESLPAPDLQINFVPAFYLNHGRDRPEGHAFTFGATLLRPYSRGQVQLASRDPKAYPHIDLNFLEDPRDMDIMVKAYEISDKIAKSRAFDQYRGMQYLPKRPLKHRDDIENYIRESLEHLYHPVGTCKMGDDEMSVVDDRLRVHGIGGLRVIDASIMPSITGGNTNAPTIMIAEKGAQMLLEDN